MRVLFLLFCFPFSTLFAQKLVKGIVLDAEQNLPIPKASVFLNNTSIGTTADNEGNFTLSIPAGRFDLIVSSIGYGTYNQSINGSEVADFLTIKLKLKAPDLEAVIIEPFEKDGWAKWGRWFTDNFIGTSEYGRDTRIINPEVIKFRNSKKNGELTAIAIAPLQIENKALGYRLTYQLENFRYSFKERYLLYAGYPFFEMMPGGDRKQRKWEKAREDVYHGSMLQFMRALYRNKIMEEGFEVRRLKKIPNVEKQRVRMVYKTSVRADEHGRLISTVNTDSTEYYNHVMSQNDYKNFVEKEPVPGDSIAYAISKAVAGFEFPDYLLVTYKHKTAPAEYRQVYPKNGTAISSEITLINGRPVEVLANGSYFNPEDLLSIGWWGWWEKIGTMLPFDYQPPKQ
jgi:hypothetical protein